MTVRQGRYEIKHVLKTTEETRVTVAVAYDTQANNARVVLKRWECTDLPLNQRSKELVYYDRATEPLTRLHHPMIPRVRDRFVEGKHYYAVFEYIDGESLEERMQKLLRPLPEREVLGYMNTILNTLIALEQQRPPLRHYDISPANIIIERQRGRAMLTGFQIQPHCKRYSESGQRASHDAQTGDLPLLADPGQALRSTHLHLLAGRVYALRPDEPRTAALSNLSTCAPAQSHDLARI